MIQKNTDIHIRVSEKDKKALQRYAMNRTPSRGQRNN